jgi:hypothetical protein
MKERVGFSEASRKHVENSHFRRAKACLGRGKLCQQFEQYGPQHQQGAQVAMCEIDASLGGRLAIGAPNPASRIQSLRSDIDERDMRRRLGERFDVFDSQLEADQTQLQLRQQFGMRAKMIEQANKLQLIVWARIEPELDLVVARAKLGKGQLSETPGLGGPLWSPIGPVIARPERP